MSWQSSLLSPLLPWAKFTYGCKWLSQQAEGEAKGEETLQEREPNCLHVPFPQTQPIGKNNLGLGKIAKSWILLSERALCLTPVGSAGLRHKVGSVFWKSSQLPMY